MSAASSPHHLSARIESLQEAFRRLPKGAGLRDLAGQFARVVGDMFPRGAVHVARRSVDDQHWENLIESDPTELERFFPSAGEKVPAVCEISETPESIILIQRLADFSLLGLVVSGKPELSWYSEFDVVSLRLLVHLLDNAYQDTLYRQAEKRLAFSLNHGILQLNSLIDTGIEVSSLDDHSSPHRLALMRAAALTNASRGTVRVVKGGKLLEEYVFPEGARPVDIIHSSIATAFTFSSHMYSFELFNKEGRTVNASFEETDQLVLDALARQVHASLENRYLHQQALEKQRIEHDMEVAASIQQKIIPHSLPKIQGYDIAGMNVPSKSVGGDYFDCLRLKDGRYALVIADVAGKGVPAALLVSSLHAYLTAYLEVAGTLPELLGKLDRALYNTSTPDKFVTAFIALLSPETGELEYSNAGHSACYLLKRDGEVRELRAGGFPLGAFDMNVPYPSKRLRIERGERLLLYTDGITEATNEQKESYEQHRPLPEFLARNKPEKADAFVADLITELKNFTGTTPQNDDITVLYLYRRP